MIYRVVFNGSCGGGNHFFYTFTNATISEMIILSPDDLLDRGPFNLNGARERFKAFLKEESDLRDPDINTKIATRNFQS